MARTYEVRMGSQGRLVIPSELRAKLAAEEGTVYIAHVDETGALVLNTPDQALRELQRTWMNTPGGSASQELVAQRRQEAAAE